MHRGEDISVIAGSTYHQAVHAESILYHLSHVFTAEVCHYDLLGALRLQYLTQSLGCLCRVTVYGSMGHQDTLRFYAIAAPYGIKPESLSQFLILKDGTMERADSSNVQTGSLLQYRAHGNSIFSTDIEVIAARFAGPVIGVCIDDTELSESIRREEGLLLGTVGHDDLRPVYHGSADERQRTLAE